MKTHGDLSTLFRQPCLTCSLSAALHLALLSAHRQPNLGKLIGISIVKHPQNVQHLKFILFWNYILHVSDGLSIHHQESKTVHTASGICHTASVAAC
jgi:hypothetical protein